MINLYGYTVQPVIDFANIFVVLLTTIGIILALLEFRRERDRKIEVKRQDEVHEASLTRRQRESDARETYRQYLLTCLAHPKLSIAVYDKTRATEIDRYDSFISLMLYTDEELIESTMDVDSWRKTIAWQVEVHSAYLRPLFHREVPSAYSMRASYSENLIRVIDDSFDALDRGESVFLDSEEFLRLRESL